MHYSNEGPSRKVASLMFRRAGANMESLEWVRQFQNSWRSWRTHFLNPS